MNRIFNFVNYKSNLLAILIFVLLTIPKTKAQPNNVSESTEILDIYAGFSVFGNPLYDSVSLLECRYSFNRSKVEFYATDSTESSFTAEISAYFDVYDSTGLIFDSASSTFGIRVNSRGEITEKDIKIFDKLSLLVKPGHYSARLTIYDLVGQKKGEFFFGEVTIDPISKTDLKIGGAFMAYETKYVGELYEGNKRLVKNGYLIYPSPNGIYSTEDSTVSIYYELYNISEPYDSTQSVSVKYSALKRDSTFIGEIASREIIKTTNSAVVVETFNVFGWAPGVYHIEIVAEDDSATRTDRIIVPFAIITPITKESLRLTQEKIVDPYELMSLKEKTNLVTYLLTPQQKKTLKLLSDIGKNNFLEQYWKDNDSTKNTSINETRLMMIERYNFVNKYFSADFKKDNGWSTDRGRIFMTYGYWDEKDDISHPRAGNPYVVWYYRWLGAGKLFVFEDWTGTSDYRLVHSNVYGEMFNPSWEDLIQEGPRLDHE